MQRTLTRSPTSRRLACTSASLRRALLGTNAMSLLFYMNWWFIDNTQPHAELTELDLVAGCFAGS